ncbi:Uncharacterized protein APZ42_016620 [Daphnia magna]|uniref:Uncharacterized protein n=1 Tax=Daphnia magna TaxID=35525 RepID=A0A165ABX5_9CRUS|nr:Uncharacterized protein APZ42_016620 [Daphnia magna]
MTQNHFFFQNGHTQIKKKGGDSNKKGRNKATTGSFYIKQNKSILNISSTPFVSYRSILYTKKKKKPKKTMDQ